MQPFYRFDRTDGNLARSQLADAAQRQRLSFRLPDASGATCVRARLSVRFAR